MKLEILISGQELGKENCTDVARESRKIGMKIDIKKDLN